MITDQTRIPQIDNKEVQQIRSELIAKDEAIINLTHTVNDLTTKVTDLQLQLDTATKEAQKTNADLNLAIAKIAQLQADIQKMEHNQQTLVESAKAEALASASVRTLFTELLNRLRG